MKRYRHVPPALAAALLSLVSPAFPGDLDSQTVNNWADSIEELEEWGESPGRGGP